MKGTIDTSRQDELEDFRHLVRHLGVLERRGLVGEYGEKGGTAQ